MNLLFWNLKKKQLSSYAIQLCRDQSVDICAFAESDCIDDALFNNEGMRRIKTNSNIALFSRYSSKIIKVIMEGRRYSIILLNSPISGIVMICVVHLVSAASASGETRIIETTLLANEIRNAQKLHASSHTIIFGDFNQNPYDAGMVAGGCFNATADRMIAEKMQRIIQGRPHPYMYNPMWKFYGSKVRPFGTYFYSSSDHMAVNWNILDQFLISPSLLHKVCDNDFKIITNIGSHQLIRNNGNINARVYSDHLPILMKSKL